MVSPAGPVLGGGGGSPQSTTHQTGDKEYFDSEHGGDVISELKATAVSHMKTVEALDAEAAGTAENMSEVCDEFNASDARITSGLVFKTIMERARRPRPDEVADMPAELRVAGLPREFWLALDAPSRHYLKRRAGKIKSRKLLLKAIGFVVWNLVGDLERAGLNFNLEELQNAVKRSCLLPWYFFEDHEEGWRHLWLDLSYKLEQR